MSSTAVISTLSSVVVPEVATATTTTGTFAAGVVVDFKNHVAADSALYSLKRARNLFDDGNPTTSVEESMNHC